MFTETPFTAAGESAAPEWLVGLTLPMAIVFEATQAGTYSIELTVDDTASHMLPIHIVHGTPPGAQPAA